jgi:hypothetical protein
MNIVKAIFETHQYNGDLIIKTKIDYINQFNCYAATNHKTGNHIYLMELSDEAIIPKFKNFNFKGVRIEVLKHEKFKELVVYLLDNQLKDIFSLFIDDILNEIKECITENEALIKTSNVILKWKRLFDKVNFQGLSDEKQKGLIGELIVLSWFIDKSFALEDLIDNWTGPDYEDKDFVFGSVGLEIKFTASKVPSINITSERQLDSQNLNKLFLILHIAEQVKEKGHSLNSIIAQIRTKIIHDHNALKKFNDKILMIGYFEDDFEYYNQQFGIKNSICYLVDNEFPKIIKPTVSNGIFNTKYSIELSACENKITNFETILSLL